MALLDLMKTGMALAQTAAKAASQKSGATGTAQAKKTPAATSGGAWTTGKDALGQTDYSVLLKNAMTAGASAGEVQDLLTKRTQKALSSDAYSPYAKDDVYREAQAYIDAQRKPKYQEFDASGYTAAKEAQDAYLKAQLQKTIDGLEAQKGSVTDSAEEAARQAYISYMQSRNTLPQALAASGYAGGMADSQRLALDTNLQNSQQAILKSRDAALNDIDTAVNNARLESSVQGAQAQVDLARDAIAAYQNFLNQQNAYANQDFWTRYGYDFQAAQDAIDRQHQLDLTREQWQRQQEQAKGDAADADRTLAQKQAYESAWNMISSGLVPSAEMLYSAGISQADAEAYAALARNQASKTGKVSVTPQSADPASTDDERLDPYGRSADETTKPTPDAGVDARNMASIKQTLAQAAKTDGNVQVLIDQLWDNGQLSEAQKEEIKRYIEMLGGKVE